MSEALEDHAGDILRKAREAAGMDVDAAARSSGLARGEYEALESRGEETFVRNANLSQLARSLDLDAVKLMGILKGWHPKPADLTVWREMRRVASSRDGLDVQCWLIWDEVTREAALFDTGWDAVPILNLVREHDLQLKHLFLTHTHEDHVAAMGELRAAIPALRLHTNSRHAPLQHRNRPQDFIHLGSLRVTNRALPGHAEDGVAYLVGNWPEDAPHVAFVGDTLFAGSLATGFESFDQLKRGVREQLFTLPDATLSCPGHGPPTTVGEEKMHNPFFVLE